MILATDAPHRSSRRCWRFDCDAESTILLAPQRATRSDEMAPSTLAQWVGALGTIAAVVVALFKDEILARRRRPILDAKCDKAAPWTVKTPIEVHDGKGLVLWKGGGYYVRAQIENSGRSRAEKVQVYASKLAKLGADGKFEDIPTFLPLNMRWANTPPGGQAAILDGISPGMGPSVTLSLSAIRRTLIGVSQEAHRPARQWVSCNWRSNRSLAQTSCLPEHSD
jgi:hypothetical protein